MALYNVASSVQDILERKKAENLQQQEFQRKLMLDELTRKKTESDIKMNEEYRGAMADDRRAQAEQRILSGLDDMGLDPGTVLGDTQLGPEQLDVAKKHGRVLEKFVPNPQGETEGTLDQRNVYQGTREAREEFDKQERIRKLTTSPIWTDPNSTREQKIAALYEAMGKDLTATEASSLVGPVKTTKPFYSVDRSGKPVYTGDIPADAIIRQEPAPVQPRATPRPRYQIMEQPDPNDPTKKVLVRVNMDNLDEPPTPLPSGVTRLPTAGQVTAATRDMTGPVINPNLAVQYGVMMADYKSKYAQNPNSQAAIAAGNKMREVGNQLLATANVPDEMRTMIDQIIQRKDQRTTQQILDALMAAGADPIEVARFSTLLRAIRGEIRSIDTQGQ